MDNTDLPTQRYNNRFDVGHDEHAWCGSSDWALGNAKDPPWVAPFSTMSERSPKYPATNKPAELSFHSTVMTSPLLPFVAPANYRSPLFTRKVDPAQAHTAGVDMHTYREHDGLNNSDMEDDDTTAIDDVDMYDIASCNTSEDPTPSVATDIEMSDPEPDALTALLADWHPFHHMVPVLTTQLVLWQPFEPVTRDKRTGLRIKHSIRPVKRRKVFHKHYPLSPWSSSLLTTTGRQRRHALRCIKFNSLPITTTATPSPRSLHTPTFAASSITTTTPATPSESSTTTLAEFDTPKQHTFTSPSNDDDDIAMGDGSEDMDLVSPKDDDIATGNASKDMGIDALEHPDSIMYDANDDMDIDLPEDKDFIMFDVQYDMDVDTLQDDNIILYDASGDMDND